MAFLKHANRAYSTLAGAINDSDDPVTFSVQAGHGARYPSTGNFNVSVYNPATPDTREILTITSRTTDSLTGTRAQEGTAKIAHAEGDNVWLNVTSGLLDEIEAAIDAKAPVGCISIFVASATATAAEKAMATATYTADATEDDVQLNAALTALT